MASEVERTEHDVVFLTVFAVWGKVVMVEVRNHLLRSILDSGLGNMVTHLEYVKMPLRMCFEEVGQPIKSVCFPEDGIISVVAGGDGARQLEAVSSASTA